jgi:hypothetical protein
MRRWLRAQGHRARRRLFFSGDRGGRGLVEPSRQLALAAPAAHASDNLHQAINFEPNVNVETFFFFLLFLFFVISTRD